MTVLHAHTHKIDCLFYKNNNNSQNWCIHHTLALSIIIFLLRQALSQKITISAAKSLVANEHFFRVLMPPSTSLQIFVWQFLYYQGHMSCHGEKKKRIKHTHTTLPRTLTTKIIRFIKLFYIQNTNIYSGTGTQINTCSHFKKKNIMYTYS